MTKYTDEEYKLIRDIVADMSNACDGFIFDREANICLLLDPEVAKDVISDSARTLCALVERSAKKTGGWHQNSEKKMPLHISIKNAASSHRKLRRLPKTPASRMSLTDNP